MSLALHTPCGARYVANAPYACALFWAAAMPLCGIRLRARYVAIAPYARAFLHQKIVAANAQTFGAQQTRKKNMKKGAYAPGHSAFARPYAEGIGALP